VVTGWCSLLSSSSFKRVGSYSITEQHRAIYRSFAPKATLKFAEHFAQQAADSLQLAVKKLNILARLVLLAASRLLPAGSNALCD